MNPSELSHLIAEMHFNDMLREAEDRRLAHQIRGPGIVARVARAGARLHAPRMSRGEAVARPIRTEVCAE